MSDETSDPRAINRRGGRKAKGNPDWFVGNVEAEAILELPEKGLRQGRVHFHDGARTSWHLHLGDQVLYFVEGLGMVEDDLGNRFETQAGDIVHVPTGTRHIHGARPDTSAVHIAITAGETIWEIDPRYASGTGASG